MVARNQLLTAPPFPVEQAVIRLWLHSPFCRMARIRRKYTIEEVAEKTKGAGRRAVAGALKAQLSPGIAVYAALLWPGYGLNQPLEDLANPCKADEQGLAFMGAKAKHPRP